MTYLYLSLGLGLFALLIQSFSFLIDHIVRG